MGVFFEIYTIADAFTNAEQFPANGILFAPVTGTFQVNTKWALLTEWNWDEDPPETLMVEGQPMEEFLNVDQFQQVVWNAKAQRPHASVAEIIAALEFYYKYDAFIDFDDTEF